MSSFVFQSGDRYFSKVVSKLKVPISIALISLHYTEITIVLATVPFRISSVSPDPIEAEKK
ncbi:MAG TPA: hypothetical protein ACFCUY_13070 [Xenococcaceae cyanobacterium]